MSLQAKKEKKALSSRYHQLDVIRKVLADVRENQTAQNYLIQHSAGSGNKLNRMAGTQTQFLCMMLITRSSLITS